MRQMVRLLSDEFTPPTNPPPPGKVNAAEERRASFSEYTKLRIYLVLGVVGAALIALVIGLAIFSIMSKRRNSARHKRLEKWRQTREQAKVKQRADMLHLAALEAASQQPGLPAASIRADQSYGLPRSPHFPGIYSPGYH